VIRPEARVSWPWYLAGGFGINIAVIGGIAGVWGLARGAGAFTLIPMAISVGGLVLYRWAQYSFLKEQAEPKA